jgi:putative ABC transport system permease protein
MISGGYFAAMGIPVLSGRTFSGDDVREGGHVAIVSAALAKKYWPGGDPLGRRVRFDDKPGTPWITIVGVAADTRQLGLAEAPPPLLYVPYTAFPLGFTTVVVRSALPQATAVSLVRSQLAAVDPALSFGDTSSLQDILDRSVEEPRFRATLVGAFAGLALLLAAVGVYGLISYTVTQRTREIGIRVALGAAPRQVLGSIVREGLTLAVMGIAIGLAAALIAARAVSSLLFGVGASDPLTFAAVAVLLLVIAAAASYIPSRRALRIDPIIALRAE